MAAENNFCFSENDSLLCYYGSMLYEAKCLKRRMKTDGGNGAQYYIHYKGWNSKWEEWVNDDRVLDINPANMNKMAELKELHSRKTTKKHSHTTKNKIIKTSVKVVKHEHSNTSLESIKLVNVTSPIVLKQKKRGRVSETTINTSKPFEINEEQELCKVNDANKALVVVEETKIDKVIEAVNKTVKVKSVYVAAKTQITDDDNVDNTRTFDGTDKGNEIIAIEEEFADIMVGIPLSTVIQIKNIPLILKRRLSHDNLMIEKQKKMLLFSKYNTIDLLLRDYVYSTSELSVKEQEISKAISLTLIQYFNWYIHTQLLYNIEREKNIIKKATNHLYIRIQTGLLHEYPVNKHLFIRKLWHYVYGPSFLLRLLVKWPNLNLIYSDKYNAEQTKRINEYFVYFLKYLEDNYEKYFSDQDYK